MKLETPHLEISEEPEHRVEGGRRVIAFVVALALLAASITALSVIVVRQGAELRDRDTQVATLQAQRTNTLEEMAALSETNRRLRDRLAANTGELREELDEARRDLVSMVGPALPEGRHFGLLIAVGVDQSPPRLIIDVEQWFTDEAADQAASEDGALYPGQTHVENGYYIRNENPRWRVVKVDPRTMVALTTFPFGQIDQPLMVGFERFTHLYARDAHGLRLFPYWITVRDGQIVAIEEQFIP